MGGRVWRRAADADVQLGRLGAAPAADAGQPEHIFGRKGAGIKPRKQGVGHFQARTP